MPLFTRLTHLGFLAVLALLGVHVLLAQTSDAAPVPLEPIPPGTHVETVLSNMTQPVALAFDPAGRLFYTERTGSVRLFANGQLQPDPVIAFSVDTCFERGLLGITLDPAFPTNHYVYVYYTAWSGSACGDTTNKVVRFVETDGAGSNPVELFSSPAIGAGNHNGGNLHFGADGKLYISIGDDASAANAQNLNSKNGKMHRLNADGSIPTDNPWYGQPNTQWSNYARGLRNSFDFDFDPVSGWLFASENGPNCDDEMNRILGGYNYGWRSGYPCGDSDPQYNTIPPLWRWTPTIAPTGAAFYRGSQIAAWQNELFMCAYNTGRMYHLYLSADRTTVTAVTLIDNTGMNAVSCHMDIETGADGALYYLQGGGYETGVLKRIVADAITPTPVPPTNTPTSTPTRTDTPTHTPTPAPTATPIPATCTLSASRSGNDVVLSWTAEPGAIEYRIYRGTTPYFAPPYGSPYATTAGLSYTDVGVLGDPDANFYYVVTAWNGSVEAPCNRRAGEFDYAMTAGPDYLNDLAAPLDLAPAITDADSYADSIDPVHVLQALKWDPVLQSFLAWSNEFGFGDNFAIQPGDYIFVGVDASAPTVASFVGSVPEPGSVRFALAQGPLANCALNFLSLPLDQPGITTADQLADSIGTGNPPGPATVQQALDWDAPSQNFLAWSNQFNFGDDFATSIGYPYIVCLGPQAPGEDAYVVQTDPTGTYGVSDPTHLIVQGSRGLVGGCNTTRYAYVKFGLARLARETVTATLALNNAQFSGGTSGFTLGLYGVSDDSWSEGSVTWNTRPEVGGLLSTTSQVVGQGRIVFPTSVGLVDFINAQREGDGVASFAVGWVDCPTLSVPQLRVDSSEGTAAPQFVLTAAASR